MPIPRSTFIPCALLLAGCSGPPSRGVPPPRPLGADVAAAADRTRDPEEPDGPLDLRTALALALLRSPSLDAAYLDVRAAEAHRLQEGLLPNPEAAWSLENTGGDLHDEAESTIVLSQLIELGGKRSARRAVAAGEADLAGWDHEARRLDVLTGTARDFVAVLEAQDRLGVAEQSKSIADEVLTSTRARAEAGAVGPVEVRRAEIEAETTVIELERAAADLAAARARLAANWGADRPRFSEAAGDLGASVPLPSLAALLPHLDRNPDLARFEAELRMQEAGLDSARAGRLPDVTVGVGHRRFDASNEETYLFEVGVPLPLFDRNQGAVAEAESRIAATRRRREAVAKGLRADLAAAHATLRAAMREAEGLGERVVPWAREILDATTERYRLGKVGYLELLDARRTFADAAAREASARADVQSLRIEIERLIAGPLEPGPIEATGQKE